MTELELAEAAVAGKDDRLALHYLAHVLATAPNSERGLALLAGLATRLDVLKFVPSKGFVGNTVLKAWVLQRAGSPESIRLLARAATQAPQRSYDRLLASWLVARQASGLDLPEVSRQACYRFLSTVLEPTIGLHRLWPGERVLLEGAVDCAMALEGFPRDELGVVLVSAVLRRAGRVEEALAMTAEGAARGEVALLRAHGLALRTAGRGAEAAGAFARVEALEPDRAEILEQVRSWYVAREPGRALEVFGRLPRPWTDESLALERLCHEAAPTDPVARLDRLQRSLRGHGLLAARVDGTAALLRRTAQRERRTLKVSAPGWESPSNRLALALATNRGTDVTAAPYEAEPWEPSFDPLAPCDGLGLELWRLGRGGVQQACVPPSPEVLEAVRRVAEGEGDGLALLEAAEREASAFAPERAAEFAAAMVHPPAGHSGDPEALYRTQCAAAALIAHLPGPIEGPRGTTLRALALGQVDWTASAAVFALAHLARHDREAAHFAREVLLETVPRLVPHSAEPRAEQLRTALATIPAIPPEALVAVDARARALD